MLPARRALLSVSDKSGLVEFARGLAALGIELVSTGGTARHLTEAGLPVTPVSDVTSWPSSLSARRIASSMSSCRSSSPAPVGGSSTTRSARATAGAARASARARIVNQGRVMTCRARTRVHGTAGGMRGET